MTENENWWESEDFDSPAFKPTPKSDHEYLKNMWGDFRAGGVSKSLAQDTVTAHRMVQAFINAFARDGFYMVTFDEDVSTAGTDMAARKVVITPAPIADMNLTAEEAGLVLTGLAVHEISHPRYGRDTAEAVRRAFMYNRVAHRLSNLLDDIRIEQRFVEEYPGYAGIFDPTLDYVGAAGTKGGKELHKQSIDSPCNLAIAATRYPKWSEWDEVTLAEADWWRAWADRWAPEDAPARHVAAIREALAHIVNVKDDPPGKGGKSAAGDGEDGASASAESGPGNHMSDTQLNRETGHSDADEGEHVSSCSGSVAVERAAQEGDTNASDIARLKAEAQEIVDSARNIEDGIEDETVDVNRSTRGLMNGWASRPKRGSDSVSRMIRNAIIQSRTGHMEVEPYRKTGRLDQKGLVRIAHGDYRTFEKRTAPSVGRYLVWVMVDVSMSMDGNPIQQAAKVAHSIASAATSLPSVRMEVWAWTSAFRNNGASAGAVKVWGTGVSVDKVFDIVKLNTGGTPDAVIMGWAGKAIRREAHRDETPVIIMISDGQGMPNMNERIAQVRAAGVTVVGVSFGSDLKPAALEARYGKNNYVPFQKTIENTGKSLAKMFVKIVTAQKRTER